MIRLCDGNSKKSARGSVIKREGEEREEEEKHVTCDVKTRVMLINIIKHVQHASCRKDKTSKGNFILLPLSLSLVIFPHIRGLVSMGVSE